MLIIFIFIRENVTLIIIATDGGGRTGNATVVITITDENDNAPTFNRSRYDMSVTEEEANVMVGAVYATDPDYQQNGMVL